MARVQILHHVRRLEGVIDRELLVCGIPVCNLAARLQGYARMTSKLKSRLSNSICPCKSPIHLTHVQAAGETEVIAELWVDHWCGGIQCGFHVNHWLKFLNIHLQDLQRILSLLARLSNEGDHGLPLPTRAIHRQRILRC